nr:proline-rich protein 2-like [Rhipicephalus microplus]
MQQHQMQQQQQHHYPQHTGQTGVGYMGQPGSQQPYAPQGHPPPQQQQQQPLPPAQQKPVVPGGYAGAPMPTARPGPTPTPGMPGQPPQGRYGQAAFPQASVGQSIPHGQPFPPGAAPTGAQGPPHPGPPQQSMPQGPPPQPAQPQPPYGGAPPVSQAYPGYPPHATLSSSLAATLADNHQAAATSTGTPFNPQATTSGLHNHPSEPLTLDGNYQTCVRNAGSLMRPPPLRSNFTRCNSTTMQQQQHHYPQHTGQTGVGYMGQPGSQQPYAPQGHPPPQQLAAAATTSCTAETGSSWWICRCTNADSQAWPHPNSWDARPATSGAPTVRLHFLRHRSARAYHMGSPFRQALPPPGHRDHRIPALPNRACPRAPLHSPHNHSLHIVAPRPCHRPTQATPLMPPSPLLLPLHW